MRPFKNLLLLFIAIQTIILMTATPNAHAQGMTKYIDEDGIFHVLIPDTYKINKKYFRIDENEVAISGEVVATEDQRPYKDVVKQYIIKYEQTIAHSITENDIASLLNLELGKYIDYYTALGGVIRNKELNTYGGKPGGEVVMSYRDKERGIQSIRVRIIYSDVTKVEQIVIGPEDSMFAYKTKDFYDSLQVNDGRTELKGDLQKEWDTVTSPFAISTQLVPRKNPPFVENKPEFTNSDKIERMSMRFTDPVYGYTMFYNIYGYRFGSLLTNDNVQKVIMDKHLKKFKINIRDLKFSMTSKNNYPVLSTTMHFPAPPQYPFMNTIKLHAHFFGNFLVVQEFAGTNFHVNSVFAQNISKYFKFSPVAANKVLVKERAERQMKGLREEEAADDEFGDDADDTDPDKES